MSKGTDGPWDTVSAHWADAVVAAVNPIMPLFLLELQCHQVRQVRNNNNNRLDSRPCVGEGASGAQSSQALQRWGMTIIQAFFHSASLYEKSIPSQGWHREQELLAVNRRDTVPVLKRYIWSGKWRQAGATSHGPGCACSQEGS